MNCPKCNHDETRVFDTRYHNGGRLVYRRRQCSACSAKFTTNETAVPEEGMTGVVVTASRLNLLTRKAQAFDRVQEAMAEGLR